MLFLITREQGARFRMFTKSDAATKEDMYGDIYTPGISFCDSIYVEI